MLVRNQSSTPVRAKLRHFVLGSWWRFGVTFVALGAALEWVKIHWHVGDTSFYNIYRRNAIRREKERLVNQLDLAEKMEKEFASIE